MTKHNYIFSVIIAVLLAFKPVYSSAQSETTSDFNYFTASNSLNQVDIKSNLYQQILDEMNLEYQAIGLREARRVLENNNGSVTGGLNSIGFNYQRPFVDFSISANRTLAPDLFDAKRWIVTDTFSIYIDASRVLSNLKDQKVIDISEKNLAAFAGILFKRNFTWVHFANSYEEGLTTQFEKLFMPFAALEFKNISKLGANEIVTKEDSITLKAGGIVSAPLYTGITAMAGVLAKFEQIAKVQVVSNPGLIDGITKIELSSEKTKSTSTGFSLGIQADFLKILKMTLLSYDFSYELASSYKIYLNFNQNELNEMTSDNPVENEINKLLGNKEGNLLILAPYVISEEKKVSQTIAHKYNFLLLGGAKNSQTQQIEITSDKRVKTFFRHYYEKIKYTEDALSRFFASLIFALTNSDASAAKLASDTKKVTIEYDAQRNLLENREDLNIAENEQKLSMSFVAEFMTKKTTGLQGKKYLERAKFYLDRFSGIDPMILSMVDNGHLKAPFLISGRYEVNNDGVRYLNAQSVGDVFEHFGSLCSEYPRTSFFNFRNLFDNCRRSLQNDYMDYYKNLSHDKITSSVIDVCEKKSHSLKFLFSPSKKRNFIKNCLAEVTYKDKDNWVEIPLWSLKTLTTNIVNNSNSKVDYYNLFGLNNVFFYGYFNAQTEANQDFSTYFHEGDFKGLGVVDHYMREENLRAPSSIVVDQ